MAFRHAVHVLQSFNGIEFKCDGREVGTYRKVVVTSICSTISPDVKWDDSHIQGRSKLLEVTREKEKGDVAFKKIWSSYIWHLWNGWPWQDHNVQDFVQ